MTPYIRPFPQPDGSTMICEASKINGVVVRLPTRYVRPDGTEKPAPSPPKQEPRRIEAQRTYAQKAATFAKSAARHIAAGMPQATDAQVAQRFAICQACPHFIPKSDGQGECSKCGCGLKSIGVAGINKLRWADEACPVGRWKALPLSPPAE